MKLARRASRPVGFDDGTLVAGYVVTRLVGPGSTGELIYEAETQEGRSVSLVAGQSPRGEAGDLARFRRLARLRSDVEHPGLLAVHDWGEQDGVRFLVTAPYPTQRLSDLLARQRQLIPETAIALLSPVADALDLCHRLGLIHQHLTDQSVLLDGERAVLDGFAIVTGGPDRTWDSLAAHDLRYGTPEAMRGEPVEGVSNVYSFTALLLHILTGHAPYEGLNAAPSNAAWASGIVHLVEPPPRLSDRAPELGSEIDGVIAWGMSKEPSQRAPSATALLHAAADALGLDTHRMPSTRRAIPIPEAAASFPEADREPRSRRQVQRFWRPAAIAAAAVLGLVCGAVVDPFAGDEAPVRPERPDGALIAQLSERRAELRSELAGAELPQDQSAAAAALASSYRTVAERAPSPALARAARDAASAYDELAAAAELASEVRFADAASSVDRAEDRLAATTDG